MAMAFEYYLDELDQFSSKSIDWHWHREVEFSLVLRGTIHCHTETERCVLTPGDGLFINSECIHRFESNDSGAMVSMVFAPELIAPQGSLIYSEYIEKILTSDCQMIQFRTSDQEENVVREQIAHLYETTHIDPFAIYNAASVLWELLARFTGNRLSQTEKLGAKLLRARMKKMVQFIQTNYRRRIRLDEISAAADVSVSEALRCFHAATQTTPICFLNDHRLSCAKELLLSTQDTVTAIAFSTGFESPSYFCRLFKRRYKASPNEFRKNG